MALVLTRQKLGSLEIQNLDKGNYIVADFIAYLTNKFKEDADALIFIEKQQLASYFSNHLMAYQERHDLNDKELNDLINFIATRLARAEKGELYDDVQ